MTWKNIAGPHQIAPADGNWNSPLMDRKLRLWGVACIRPFIPMLSCDRLKEISLKALDRITWIAEHSAFPTDEVTLEDVVDYHEQVANFAYYAVDNEVNFTDAIFGTTYGALEHVHTESFPAGSLVALDAPILAAIRACYARNVAGDSRKTIKSAFNKFDKIGYKNDRAELFRDIFGPQQFSKYGPKLDLPTLLAWNNGALRALVASIQEGKWEDMPVLADALEDAGCDHELTLRHCRSSKKHDNGCWVMDLLTDKGSIDYIIIKNK